MNRARSSRTGPRLGLLRVRRMVVKELRQLFRDPRTRGVIFVSPVIQLLLFGYAVNTDVRDVSMALVDHDRSASSRALVDAMTASGYFAVRTTSDRSASLGRALDRGQVVVGLEIPVRYGADLVAGRTPAVQLLVDGTNSNTATVAQGYAVRIVQRLGARVAAERAPAAGGAAATAAGRATAPAAGPAVELRARAWFNPSLESRVYNVPAVIGVIVLLMCLLLTSMAVVREREVGTLEQLLVSPLTPIELMLGKTLPVAGVAMIQITIVTTVALLWFDIPFRGSPPTLILAAALFILAGLSFGLLISTISNTQQEAFLAMFLFLLPAIILSGFLFPVATMPSLFQYLTLANPLRHFLEIVRGVFLKGAGLQELGIQFAVLAAMAVAGLLGAARRFERSL
jgi:ABC-2 type transport system permease protein